MAGKGERRRTWVVSLKLTESAFTAEADGIQTPKEGSVWWQPNAGNEIGWVCGAAEGGAERGLCLLLI